MKETFGAPQSSSTAENHPIKAAAADPGARSRLGYLDSIRGLLSVVVVVHHVAVTYGPIGSWFYVERRPMSLSLQVGLSSFVLFNQFFFMGFFFFLAGCFAPSSLERKGFGRFVGDRLWRLGVSLIIFAFFINSWTTDLASSALRPGANPISWFPPPSFPLFRHIAPGPLWFVETLLAFSILYALARSLKLVPRALALPLPSLHLLAAFSVLLFLGSFLARFYYPISKELWHLQLGFFPQYILLFLAGLAAGRARFVEQIPNSWLRPATGVALFSLTALVLTITPVLQHSGDEEIVRKYRGGLHWQSATLCAIEAIECPAVMVALILLFRDYMSKSNSIWRALGENSYSVYIIHAPILVAVSVALRSWEPSTLVKVIVVSLLSVPLCLAISHCLLRRIPGAKSMLG